MLTSSTKDFALENLTVPQKLAVALRILGQHGIADHAAGHMTLREPGTATWWTNPWNFEWLSVRASDLVLIDAEGRVLAGATTPSPFLDVHLFLYERRPELSVVVHNHPHYVCLYAALQQPLLLLNQQSCLFYEDHVVFNEYHEKALGRENNLAIVKAMGRKNTALLKSHGMFTCARSLEAAVYQAVYLEETARLSWEACQHPAFDPARDQLLPGVARKFNELFYAASNGLFKNNWEAMARHVLRNSPNVLD